MKRILVVTMLLISAYVPDVFCQAARVKPINKVFKEDIIKSNSEINTNIQTPTQKIDMNCTGGQQLVNNECKCRNNYYWNEGMQQCRPIRTCPPGQVFDREREDCKAACSGGQQLINNECQCRNNFYWNENVKQCRPIRTCYPGQVFDHNSDKCVIK